MARHMARIGSKLLQIGLSCSKFITLRASHTGGFVLVCIDGFLLSVLSVLFLLCCGVVVLLCCCVVVFVLLLCW